MEERNKIEFNDILSLEIYHIENIGVLGFLLAIILDKNKTAQGINIEKGGDLPINKYLNGKFIVTMSNSTLIITDLVKRKRIPLIVRKWKKITEEHQSIYTDKDDNKWYYFKNRDTLKVDIKGTKVFIPFKS